MKSNQDSTTLKDAPETREDAPIRQKFYAWDGLSYGKWTAAARSHEDVNQIVQCTSCFTKHTIRERICKEKTSDGGSLISLWRSASFGSVSMFHVCPRCRGSWYYTGK